MSGAAGHGSAYTEVSPITKVRPPFVTVASNWGTGVTNVSSPRDRATSRTETGESAVYITTHSYTRMTGVIS